MACKTKIIPGKRRVVEYAISCGDKVPSSNEWVRWAAMKQSEINITWDDEDGTTTDSIGSLRESYATFQNFSFTGDGNATIDSHKPIWRHYCKPVSTDDQPLVWLRVTDPDLTYTVFCLLSEMSKPAPFDGLMTFSFTAKATASDFGLIVEETPDPDAPDVVSISAYPESIELASNETRKIAVAVEPANAPQGVVYESDDVSIATVDQNGVVTGVSVGSASITVKSTSNTLISDIVTVTVS